MEEISFRAWDLEDKRLITHEQEFVPLKVTNIGVFMQVETCCSNPNECNKWELLPKERFKIMACTKVPDKHGTEVYEGDIITSYINDTSGKMSVGIVAIRNRKVDIECLSDVACDFYLNSTHDERLKFLSSDCTVIGNIFEDKELLPDFIQDMSNEDILRRDTSAPIALGRLCSHSTTPLDERAPAYT